MNVLVVGAFGYVGQEVVRDLRERGIDTTVCDVGWYSDAITINTRTVETDLGDFRGLRRSDLVGIDAIIHLAAYSNDPLGSLSEAATLDLNFRSTVDFAALAKAAGVATFVFSSSCSVYGASGASMLDEAGPTNPLTPYAASKLHTETALRALGEPGFRTAALRGATAFGRSAAPRTDLLLNELCANAAVGRRLVLTSNGKSWRPFMPVADFARALVLAALEAPQSGTWAGLWNIAPPKMRMTVQEASSRAARVVGGESPNRAPGSAVDDRSYRIEGSKFTKDYPSFVYSDDFDAVIRDTYAGFASLPTLQADLDRQRFVRLAALERRSVLAAE